ncbi:MAG: hypothetical protein BWY82_00945 [Verrucomicrobia bacterium ADurb.Bin474]|nr:MAG: hypothetical protein BWY82_00945 [Verrucomicrobia bacterium ADurb.Bin474]
MVGLKSDSRIHRHPDDFFRSLSRYFLDLNTTFSGSDNDRIGRLPIHEDRKVILLFYLMSFGEKHRSDDSSGRSRLFRDKRIAEHTAGHLCPFTTSVGQFHPTLVPISESTFSPATCMNLRFDYNTVHANALQSRADLRRILYCDASLACDTILTKQLFGLILMYVHVR